MPSAGAFIPAYESGTGNMYWRRGRANIFEAGDRHSTEVRVWVVHMTGRSAAYVGESTWQ